MARRPHPAFLVAVVAAFAAAGCMDEPSADRFAPQTSTAALETGTNPAPQSLSVEGRGSETRTLTLEAGRPIVARADVPGDGSFRAVVEGFRYQLLLFSGRAPIREEAAVPPPGRGPVRLIVETPGPWSLEVEQPRPGPSDTPIPGDLSGRASAAVPVRVETEPSALFVSQRGAGTFTAQLMPYDEFGTNVNLFSGKGRFEREVALTEALRGSYLLAVRASGPWTLRFLP